jgi:hypothetical protein
MFFRLEIQQTQLCFPGGGMKQQDIIAFCTRKSLEATDRQTPRDIEAS